MSGEAQAQARTRARNGGDLVVESLRALGADTVFGLPGQHALGLFDALGRAEPELRYVGLRVENNLGFAADGYARTSGRVAPLFVSTGPGALTSLAALQEAAAASVPVLAVSSQIPSAGLGGRRKGFLHELPDQSASFCGVVKSVHEARTASQIPSAIAEAWGSALSAPYGPVWVEIPQDVLLGAVDLPVVRDLAAPVRELLPRRELVEEAARLLDAAERPVILAGGGVVRSPGASGELLRLAERLRAPVATTFGGKGAFPWEGEHPLSLGSWLEDRYSTELLEEADVLLVAGSGLGELSSNYHTFAPRGRMIQIEADAGKLEANHPALGLHADAAAALGALADAVAERGDGEGDGDGRAEERVRRLLERVHGRLDAQGLETEQGVLTAVREALPDDAPAFFDMTILGYWAWSAWDARYPGGMQSAQGAGGLGYAFPAAIGAAVARGARGGGRCWRSPGTAGRCTRSPSWPRRRSWACR